jgi:16S rRNA processing protein RimM
VDAADDLVLVGTVARAHGLRGEVAVHVETDFLDARFAPGATLLVERAGRLTALRVATMRMHQDRPLVRFEGVDTPEAAHALSAHALWVREADRPPLGEGRFYYTALIGCRVETTAGVLVGEVERLDPSAGVPLLVVAAPGGEVLVPLADEICRVIDPDARRIVIEPPEGLLELNRPEGRGPRRR